jgi:hypothetical protein
MLRWLKRETLFVQSCETYNVTKAVIEPSSGGIVPVSLLLANILFRKAQEQVMSNERAKLMLVLHASKPLARPRGILTSHLIVSSR